METSVGRTSGSNLSLVGEACAYDPEGQEKAAQLIERLKERGLSTLIKDRRYYFRVYEKCFIASDFVVWLQAVGEAKSDAEAVRIGQRLLDYDFIHHVTDDHQFKNDKLYFRFRADEVSSQGPSVASLKLACGVTKSGYVLVKGLLFWKKRYMICKADEQKLYVFITDLDSAPQEVLDLATLQCTVKETGECKPGYYCYQLLGPKVNYLVCVEKSRDQEGWMQAINDAGARFQEEASLSNANSLFEFTADDIDGNPVPMSRYAGKVCLVVNVASK
eukprot:TRINITY_DN684_c0_g1_i1.p1 TRINITY_DN684_c0_g1~~TRINITY_DN684_c0_g1_i1.p1  ORF type:complete len:275 (+),score=49.28 TRINITY_DN684_c0_g1_i1:197-1021(+)